MASDEPLAPSTAAEQRLSQVEAHITENLGWLRSVVMARLGEPQAVEEVVQEVCVAAIAGIDRLSDMSKLGPWLYQIAVRQCMLFRRKHGRRRKFVERYKADMQPTEVDGRVTEPLAWLLAEERSTQFRRALQELVPRDREILLLKYQQDWSYHEIADKLGISESAVEARLHRARGRLRKHLLRLDFVERA